MAGGGHTPTIKHDAAIERWNTMRERIYLNFQFTRVATRNVLVLGLAVPATALYLFYNQDSRWDWRGKQKGESLKRAAPVSEE
jgi:hypothetical protein